MPHDNPDPPSVPSELLDLFPQNRRDAEPAPERPDRRRPANTRRRRPPPEPDPIVPASPRAANAPYWVPVGNVWDRLPESMRQAVADVLAPAYERLVRRVSDDLERSAGITLVHLMWLEISDQLRLAQIVADRDTVLGELAEQRPAEVIAEHLRLVTAKNATAELLVKLRAVRQMLQGTAPPAGVLAALAHQTAPELEKADG